MHRRVALRTFVWIAASIVAGIGIWLLASARPEESDAPLAPSGRTTSRAGLEPLAEPAADSVPAAPTAPALPPGIRLSPLDPALRGVGGVRFRVVRATDGAGVADAAAVLHGTGHGGEIVHVAARSSKDGTVALADVPAGPWMTLQVDVAGEATVVRADVDVDRDRVRDLGDVVVGARRTLCVAVLDDRSRPVRGATVLARPLTAGQARDLAWDRYDPLDRSLPEAQEVATTDPEGTATLAGIPPGAYLLEASEGSRVPARTVVEVPSTIDPVLPALILRTPEIVAGRVVDPRGAPVAGACVVVVWVRALAYSFPRHEVADAEGRFRFALPRSGVPCTLWAESRERPRTHVEIGEARDDLVVTLPDGAPMDLTAADADSGAPLPAARVEIRIAEPNSPTGRATWEWLGRTDERGRLRAALPPGRLVELRVDPAGYLHGIAPPRDRDDPVFEVVPAPADVEVGRPVRVEARLHPWPDIERATVGAVPTATIRGRVIDESGRPICEASVQWGSDRALDGSLPRATTGPDGRFVLADLPSTDGAGLARSERLRVTARGHAVSGGPEFRAPSGRTVDVGDVTLERGASVVGTVFDSSGAPAGGVRLTLHPRSWVIPGPPRACVFFAVSDAQGRFRIAGEKDLAYTVLHADPRHDGEVGATIEIPADPAAREHLVLRLPEGGSCEGTVVDAEGRPVSRATVVVAIADPASGWTTKTLADERGAFRFTSVPVGPVVVGAYDVGAVFGRGGAEAAESEVSIPFRTSLRIVLRHVSDDELAKMRTSSDAHWMRDDGALVPPEDTAW